MTPRARPTHRAFPPSGPARAFTLVEAIATITIVAVVMTASSRIVLTATDGYASAVTRAELSNAASAALERITTELRNIPLRPSTDPAEPHIDAVTATSITWSDSSSLTLTGASLQFTSAGVTSTLLNDVSVFTIQTYDESGAALATLLSGPACSAVRRIQLTLTLSKDGLSETLRTRVFLRCMVAGAAS